MNHVTMEAFSAELIKLSALQPLQDKNQSSQKEFDPTDPPKKPGILSKNFGGLSGIMGLAGTAATVGLLRKNPVAARKIVGGLKDVVTKPIKTLRTGFTSGANFVGEGASKASKEMARSKRVEMMNEAFTDALHGTATQHDVLKPGASSARKGGWLSAGERSNRDFTPSAGLKKDIEQIQEAQKEHGIIDYDRIKSVYDRIGQEAESSGLKLSRGLTSFLPGERGFEVGMAGLGGLGGFLPSTDEYGNERGLGERIARGLTGAGAGMMTARLQSGRGLGLSKENILNPVLKKFDSGYGDLTKKLGLQDYLGTQLSSHRSALSQKTLVPAALGLAVSPFETFAEDVAGGAGSLVDRAFGQGDSE